MFEAIIYNIAVTVAGIYLFHRLQYSENKNMVFSQVYVAILMTIIALLLAVNPIPLMNRYELYLTFVPLLFLGRYTNMFLYRQLGRSGIYREYTRLSLRLYWQYYTHRYCGHRQRYRTFLEAK